MPQHRRVRFFAAAFFCGVLFCYAWVIPRFYDFGVRGYADFSAFYTAGKIVQRGQGGLLYDRSLQRQVQREFSQAAVARNRELPYLRPPFEALLFLPLTFLSYVRAYKIWVAISILLVVVTARFLRARIPEHPPQPWWIYYPAYFSYWPIAYGWVLGQDCGLMLLLFALMMVQLRRGRDFLAGCFLGLALIKFQLVLPLLFVLVLKKQFRMLAGFSLVAVPLAGVSLWVVGWNSFKAYPAYLWGMNRAPAAAAIFPGMMPSLRGLLQGWMDPMHSSAILSLATGVVSLALLVWAARHWTATAPRDSKVYLAGIDLVLVATLLAGYHMFSYDLSLLLPTVLRAAHIGLGHGELDRNTRRALLGGATALLLTPLYFLLVSYNRVNLMALALFLLAWGLARASRTWQLDRAEVARSEGTLLDQGLVAPA